MAEVTYISYSARAKSTTADGIFAEAHQILDVSKNNNQQAINAEVTTELGKKVAKSDFDSFKTSNTSAIAAKADKSYVDTELKKKADAADVQNVQLALGQKVNTSDFNEHKTSSSLLINAKADGRRGTRGETPNWARKPTRQTCTPRHRPTVLLRQR